MQVGIWTICSVCFTTHDCKTSRSSRYRQRHACPIRLVFEHILVIINIYTYFILQWTTRSGLFLLRIAYYKQSCVQVFFFPLQKKPPSGDIVIASKFVAHMFDIFYFDIFPTIYIVPEYFVALPIFLINCFESYEFCFHASLASCSRARFWLETSIFHILFIFQSRYFCVPWTTQFPIAVFAADIVDLRLIEIVEISPKS